MAPHFQKGDDIETVPPYLLEPVAFAAGRFWLLWHHDRQKTRTLAFSRCVGLCIAMGLVEGVLFASGR